MSQLPFLGRLKSALDTLRGNYWFLPMMMAVGAGVLSLSLVALERSLAESFINRIPWLSTTEPEGTRAVLSVIAGSMITVTGVVFSNSVAALTLASSQFGPRLLRNFLRDRTNQLAFGTFVATFLYSLLVLRAVRDDDVPHLAAAVAVVLVVVSLFVLIYFIHHTATSIQASSVVASVASEISDQIRSLFPDRVAEEGASDPAALQLEESQEGFSGDGEPVVARSDGFVRVLDRDLVFDMAVENDLQIELHRAPGDFVCAGTALTSVGSSHNVDDEVLASLRDSFILGDYRTPVQDVRFLTDQLTEIAVRALSPGVDDPRTAADCVHRLGAVLCSISDREFPFGARYDREGRLRVIGPRLTFEEFVASCFDPIRRYGGEQVSIAEALLNALGYAAECCRDTDRRRTLAEHAREINKNFLATRPESARDLVAVRHSFSQAMKRIRKSPQAKEEMR